MWLIRTEDETLVSFVFENAPPYAILSHRWDQENPEVSFKDMQNQDKASTMPTYAKIRQTCEQARSDGLEYVWIDTCCIEKESSAELSEAINSMFRWYGSAKVCYALLSDIQYQPRNPSKNEEIVRSEWFERGWTLQELIAPKEVIFFDRAWKNLGTKATLRKLVSERTGIDISILEGTRPVSRESLACRMSWASERKTTRIEDTAYCLLGIFDVNMPMLYGEGDKAFLRLQEEIIKRSNDHSIFSWPLPEQTVNPSRRKLYGLLADSPAAFKGCQRRTSGGGGGSHVITSRGLSIELRAMLYSIDTYLVELLCNDWDMKTDASISHSRLAIWMTRLGGSDQFARIATNQGVSVARLSAEVWSVDKERRGEAVGRLQIYAPQSLGSFGNSRFYWPNIHDLTNILVNGFRFVRTDYFLWDKFNSHDGSWHWDRIQRLLLVGTNDVYRSGCVFSAGVALPANPEPPTQLRSIQLGFDLDCNPLVFIVTDRATSPSRLSRLNMQLSFLRKENPLLWSEPVPGSHHYLESRSHRGLWAIRGGVRDGISAAISTSPSQRPIGHVDVLRRQIFLESNKVVWDVDVYGFRNDSLKGQTLKYLLKRPTAQPGPAPDVLDEVQEQKMRHM